MSQITRFWWLRHAPVPAAADGTIPDIGAAADVSDLLRAQALRRTLPDRALWICSPTLRARQTIKALTHARPLVLEALAEQDFGTWTGQRHSDLWDSGEASYRAFWTDPIHRAPPDGESFADQYTRVSAAVLGLAQDHAGLDLILVAHAGTIRAALALALGDPEAPPPLKAAQSFTIDPWSVTRIDAIGPGWRIEGVNRRA